MKLQKILFYGPLGKKDGSIVGGGETGNLRTISILASEGFEIIKCRKPYHITRNSIGEIAYLIHLSIYHLLFPIKIIGVKGTKTLHLSGYYLNMIYFEWYMIWIARILGCKVVYELRAGGLGESIDNGSSIYKIFLKKALKTATVILTQGYEDIPKLQKLTTRPVLYYPNYIKDELIEPLSNEIRSNENCVKLVYFGRLAPSKNIDFIIIIVEELLRKGLNCHLELIGGIDKKYSQANSKNYLDEIKMMVSQKNMDAQVTITPPKKQNELLVHLQQKHFFIFPTSEKREGHSNSLTEAMSCGVVPIASQCGFNKSVVSSDDLVIYDYNPILYADKIFSIWNSGKWRRYSDKVYNHVSANYTESIVKQTLLKSYII